MLPSDTWVRQAQDGWSQLRSIRFPGGANLKQYQLVAIRNGEPYERETKLISNAFAGTLNQRVAGSNPATPTIAENA